MTVPNVPAVPARPSTPPSVSSSRSTPPKVKVADPDRVLFDNSLTPVDIIPALFLEDIGAQELITISRHDLVNGQSLIYRPIKNLQSLAKRFGSKNLVLVQGSSETFFNNFPIKLEAKVPEEGLGPFGQSVYIEDLTDDLIINVFNIAPDEQVEVQILVAGSVLDDTIYTDNTEEGS